MYKKDLALDNLQWLLCHKTHPTKPTRDKPTNSDLKCQQINRMGKYTTHFFQ